MNMISRMKWLLASSTGLALMAAPAMHAAPYSSNDLSTKASRMQAVAGELCEVFDARSRSNAMRSLDAAAESLHKTSIEFARSVRGTRNVSSLRYQVASMDSALDRIEALARSANVSRTAFAKIGSARGTFRSLENSFAIAARGNSGGWNDRDHDHDHDHDDDRGGRDYNYGGWNRGGSTWGIPQATRPWYDR